MASKVVFFLLPFRFSCSRSLASPQTHAYSVGQLVFRATLTPRSQQNEFEKDHWTRSSVLLSSSSTFGQGPLFSLLLRSFFRKTAAREGHEPGHSLFEEISMTCVEDLKRARKMLGNFQAKVPPSFQDGPELGNRRGPLVGKAQLVGRTGRTVQGRLRKVNEQATRGDSPF